MANQFVFYGKIASMKDSEKFHPVERKNFQSGWTMTRVRFNCISGSNRIMCNLQGGKWENDSKNKIIAPAQKPDGSGKRPMITIPWDKRFDEEQINSIAGFRHYVVDLGDKVKRGQLRDLIKCFKNGEDNIELRDATNCDTLEEAKEKYNKSLALRHVFISQWDFADFVANAIAEDRFKGKIFKISGNQEPQYFKGKFYLDNYEVNRIERVSEDRPNTNLNIDFYFTESPVHYENGYGYIEGWTKYYDSSLKKYGYAPISVAIHNDDDAEYAESRLICEDGEIKNILVDAAVINGAPVVDITMEDLSEETREDIDKGRTTFKEAVRAAGGNKIGEPVKELQFVRFNPSRNSAQETIVNTNDMIPAMVNTVVDEDDDL